MRSFQGNKDSVISGDVGSQPYKEDAREEHLLVMGDPLHTRGRVRGPVLVDELVGVSSKPSWLEVTVLSLLGVLSPCGEVVSSWGKGGSCPPYSRIKLVSGAG